MRALGSEFMLVNPEGKTIPQLKFKTFQKDQWSESSTQDLFGNQTVVVFAVPGAFTCPHSPIQVLGYNEYATVFKQNGIDNILCVAVNDPFVLQEWAIAEGAHQICFVPDSNGDFTKSLGMMVNLPGLGKRSWRYSMLVSNGRIDKTFIEPEQKDDPFFVSNAETMLNYINPEAKKSKRSLALMQIWNTLLSPSGS